jgi:hypothetical protein
MTCIIGFEDKENNKVYIGGDSCGSNLYNYSLISEPKVFVKDKFIFGYTSTFRFGQLIQYKLKIPEHREDKQSDYEYLVSELAEAIRKCLKDNGHTEIDKSLESGGNCLIGYKGKLYELQCDFSILRTANGFNAVGCGEVAAKTAMMILTKTTDYDGKYALMISDALGYVEEIDSHVKGPFTVFSI